MYLISHHYFNFLRACSQKLAAWQENAEIGLEKLKLTRAHTAREPRKSKQDGKSTKTKEVKAEMKTLTLNVESSTTNTNANAGLKVRKKAK